MFWVWRLSPWSILSQSCVKLTDSSVDEHNLESKLNRSTIVSDGEPSVIDDAEDDISQGEMCDNEDQRTTSAETLVSGPSSEDDSSGDCLSPVTWRSIGLVTVPSGENRMVLPVLLAGIVTTAMIDTGGSSSMVSYSWITNNNIPLLSVYSQTIYGFGVGNAIKIVGEVVLELKIHNLKIVPISLQVIDSPTQPDLPVILAPDFLVKNKVEVFLKRMMLQQRLDNGAILEYYLKSQTDACVMVCRRVPVYASAAITIAPGETGCLPVEWNGDCPEQRYCHDCVEVDSPLLFEETGHLNRIRIFPGIVGNNPSHVLVAGHAREERIKQGELVGRVSSFVAMPSVNLSGEVLVATLPLANELAKPSDILDYERAIPLSDHISKAERLTAVEMLKRRSKVFSISDQDIGKMGVMEHRIELLDDTPIYQKPRRLPEPISQEIEAQCHELELLDVIEPSSSAWSSPVVPVRKKDGKMRLCVDYRKLNAVTKPDRFPLPNLTDSVFSLHGVKYFSSLDLVRGYYQLPLESDSREYTAFSTPHGHWQFKRLSFGLKNAPAAFQREMQHMLSDFPWRRVVVYIDDVLIMSDSYEEHLELVEKVLNTLETYGVKVKLSKCTLFADQVEYLGHIVSCSGIRKCPSYVEKLANIPVPTTVRELRAFLGLANFQRKFVPNFSVIQRPLSEKSGGKSSRKIKWTPEMQTAFDQLKVKISEEVELAYPDYHEGAEPLELYVDASASGAGACLCQKQEDDMKIIAYASTSFAAAQVNYSTIEKELTALRWGIKAFRPFLIGSEFILHTDHQPLIYLNNMKLIDSRLARTLEDLADFSFEIRYTPGKENAAADCLSRLYDPSHVHISRSINFVPGKLPEGLIILEKVQGGGDALVESFFILSKILSLHRSATKSSLHLRELLADELLMHSQRYGLVLNRTSRKELRLMRQPGQLPSVEIIFAFGYLFHCVIFVHFGGKEPIGYFPPESGSETDQPSVHLQSIAGVHYNPLIETTSYVAGSYKRMRSSSPPMPSVSVDTESDEEPECVDINLSLPKFPESVEWCENHVATHTTSGTVNIAGERYCVLFDTGAQVSFISNTLFSQLDLPLDTTVSLVITGFGERRSFALGFVDLSLDLTNGCTNPGPHSFVVVDNSMMPFCIILGVDYISKHDVSLDYVDGCIRQSGIILHSMQLCTSSARQVIAYLTVTVMKPVLPLCVREVFVGSGGDYLGFAVDRDANHNIKHLASLISNEQILKHQSKCRVLTALKRKVCSKDQNYPQSLARFKRYTHSLYVIDGILVYKAPDERMIYVVTFNFLVEVLLVVHYQMAHLGRQKLIELVKKHIWHPSLSKVARDVAVSCDTCQRMKVASTIAPPVHKITTEVPFELVAVDLVSLPPSCGNIGCLVVMDHHTKWLSAVAIRSKTSAAVASAFEYRVLPYLPRCPGTILSDNGPEFAGDKFNACLHSYGIKHQYTTPNKPSSNGLVERANRTLLELLKVQVASSGTWYDALPRAILTHNNTYHSALNQSPAEFIYNNQHSLTDEVIMPKEISEMWREGHPSFGTFSFDQLVLRKSVFRGRENTNKLAERFEGPYAVTRVNRNGVTYVLKHTVTGREVKAHHTQLRIYHLPPAYIKNHPYYIQMKSTKEKLPNGDCSVDDDEDWSFPVQSDDSLDSPISEYSSDSSLEYKHISHFQLRRSRKPPRNLSRGLPIAQRTCTFPQNARITLCDDRRMPLNLSRSLVYSKEMQPCLGNAHAKLDLVEDNESNILIPTMEEYPSGIVIETDLDFWDVSPISSGRSSQLKEQDADAPFIVMQGLTLLEDSIKIIEDVVYTSPIQSIFDIFHVDPDDVETRDFSLRISQAEGSLSRVSDHLQEGSPIHQEISIRVKMAERRLDELRTSATKRQNLLRDAQEFQISEHPSDHLAPVATRSRGPVRDLPHIMTRALEYGTNRRTLLDD